MPMPPREYDNGYEFFSRGTVLIGAIEMARYMGIEEFYIFGLDCYRTKDSYYYDNRTPEHGTERNIHNAKRDGDRYVTYRLKRMISALNIVKSSGLWEGISVYCVNSPQSMQTAVPKMTLEDFVKRTKPKDTSPTLVKRALADVDKMSSAFEEEIKGDSNV